MPALLPSSRASYRVRLSLFDVFWAAASPLLALYFRDAYLLNSKFLFEPKLGSLVLLYCGISVACSILAFLVFRISDGISHYFSVHDAFNVVKAVIASGLMTSVILFTFTRLEGIPRSTPVLHFLILAAGLLTGRALMMLRDRDPQSISEASERSAAEHIIMIGTNRLSSLYIKFIGAYAPSQRRIIAVLDHEQHLIGRAMCGVPVVAAPHHLDSVIEEFQVHGVATDRIIVGGDENFLSEPMLNLVRQVCAARAIKIDFLPQLIGLAELAAPRSAAASRPMLRRLPADQDIAKKIAARPYFKLKRAIDFTLALLGVCLLSPLLLVSAILVLFDLGSPVLFWQQRVGRNHRNFFVYKFRTLRPPYDQFGRQIPDDQRRSVIGRMLRGSRIDELPQLFNVLVGDMALIGPRPLLPHDQPDDIGLRLTVRPGITGWAQINGGNLITKAEKGALDDWYIRNASLWLDARIALFTLGVLFRGERRSEQAVTEAYAARRGTSYERGQRSRPERRREQSATLRLKPAGQPGHHASTPAE
jgi:lipopolysaccharide/colanic/teichoic acid biosynthesis glycosyltransferase